MCIPDNNYTHGHMANEPRLTTAGSLATPQLIAVNSKIEYDDRPGGAGPTHSAGSHEGILS